MIYKSQGLDSLLLMGGVCSKTVSLGDGAALSVFPVNLPTCDQTSYRFTLLYNGKWILIPLQIHICVEGVSILLRIHISSTRRVH